MGFDWDLLGFKGIFVSLKVASRKIAEFNYWFQAKKLIELTWRMFGRQHSLEFCMSFLIVCAFYRPNILVIPMFSMGHCLFFLWGGPTDPIVGIEHCSAES